MKRMITLAVFAGGLVVASGLKVPAQTEPRHTADQWMAYCTDGHGALTSWLDSYDEANQKGKDHSNANHGDRWEMRSRTKP